MNRFKIMLCTAISAVMLASLGGCKSEKEQSRIDTENKEKSIEIAEEYFGDEFKYDFDFYGGAGEGNPAVDIYVFTDGDTFNCVSLPAKKNAPDPRVYYNCELHQYSGGTWELLGYEDSESVD